MEMPEMEMPEMEMNAPKTVCSCPCGGVTKTVTHVVLSPCAWNAFVQLHAPRDPQKPTTTTATTTSPETSDRVIRADAKPRFSAPSSKDEGCC